MKANLKEKKKGAIIEKFKNKCVIRKIIPIKIIFLKYGFFKELRVRNILIIILKMKLKISINLEQKKNANKFTN